jgi:hypothetical protein
MEGKTKTLGATAELRRDKFGVRSKQKINKLQEVEESGMMK